MANPWERRIRDLIDRWPLRDDRPGVIVGRYIKGPIHTELLQLLNQLRDCEDEAQRSRLRQHIGTSFESFEHSNGDGHPNPPFVLMTMRAGIATMVDGDTEQAFKLVQEALLCADTFWQEAISYGNLSELSRYRKHWDQALEYALKAVDLDPRNEGFWVHLLLALIGLAGSPKFPEAKRRHSLEGVRIVVNEILNRVQSAGHHETWAQYMANYPEFANAQISGLFPELDDLFRATGIEFEGAAAPATVLSLSTNYPPDDRPTSQKTQRAKS